MRQPKWAELRTLGRWLKMTFTSSSRRRSSDRRARASAVLLVPFSPGSLKQKYSVRLRAKSLSVTTSSRPPCPPAATAGRPCSGSFSRPPGSTTRMRPGRSVTRKRPSGRKATAHGCSSPPATVCARTCWAPASTGAPATTKAIARPRRFRQVANAISCLDIMLAFLLIMTSIWRDSLCRAASPCPCPRERGIDRCCRSRRTDFNKSVQVRNFYRLFVT